MDHLIKPESTMACRHKPGLEALALPSATLDAMKSFVVLADTQNLSEAVRILGLTRQTIRRHINLIEDIRGVVLFTLEAGSYRLTEAGYAEFRAIRDIINQASSWMDGLAAKSPELQLCNHQGPNGAYFLSQQHKITDLLSKGPNLLKRVYKAWADSAGEIEAPAFFRVKRYVLIYREQFDNWLCVHVGEQSALANWLGPVWAKSVIGSLLDHDPVANPSDEYVMQAYREVMDSGNCRYDHAAVRLSRGPQGEMEAVNYHRLLLPCRFPDGAPALAVCTFRTNNIDLGLLGVAEFERMPDSFSMEDAS